MTMKNADVRNGKYRRISQIVKPKSAVRTYVENLMRGDAVSTGGVMNQATEEALKRYRQQTLRKKSA
jgi:hypothetical protein